MITVKTNSDNCQLLAAPRLENRSWAVATPAQQASQLCILAGSFAPVSEHIVVETVGKEAEVLKAIIYLF